MKPGWKTSEFWLSFVAVLIGAVFASGMLDALPADSAVLKIVGLISSVLGALGYTAARGFVKGKDSVGAALIEASKSNPPMPPPVQ